MPTASWPSAPTSPRSVWPWRGIKKEQQLLRRLLDIHEQERQLIAYDIHDGFAQQLAGALFRLQALPRDVRAQPVPRRGRGSIRPRNWSAAPLMKPGG